MELLNQDQVKTLGEKGGYWKLTPSKKWGWKKKLGNNISEPESYSGQNYLAETLSKEEIPGLYSS